MPFAIKLVGQDCLEPHGMKVGVGRERESSIKIMDLVSVLAVIS